MKKILSSILALAALISAYSAHALKYGDITGTVYNTDIVAYINNYAIPSYAANGTSVIVAEDLRNYGFDVVWDQYARTLSISRNSSSLPYETEVKKTGVPGSKYANILYTDIAVYAGGQRIPSYAIGGYTVIPVESLTMFGDVVWVPEQRALKMWVNGLYVRNEMQPVQQYANTAKAEFQRRYDELDSWVYTGGWSQVELNIASYEEFNRWDALLNDIYQYLMATLPENSKNALRSDEINWINAKESAVRYEGEQWYGGSGRPLAENTTATEFTRSRCAYLISLIN